jgi:kumamolisin
VKRLLRRSWIVPCVIAIAVIAVAAGAASTDRVHRRRAADRYLGLVPLESRLSFALTLRMRTAALERYAAAAGRDTALPLSAEQIGARFGISDGMLARLRRRLATAGVTVTEAFRQRTELLVSATAATVRRFLRAPIGEYAQSDGRHYHRPLGTPVIPPSIRPAVVAATGLNTKPVPVYADIPEGGLAVADLTNLYDVAPLIQEGLDGSGQTVAVLSQDTFQSSDIGAFDREHGISGSPPIERVGVEGAVSYQGGAAGTEVDTDLEIIRELAPKAQIIDYETPVGPDSFSVGIDRIVSDGRAKLVNLSYGICELLLTPTQALISANNSFAAAAAAGVTVFAASGDQGAYACQRYDRADHQLSVSWPGSSPDVVSVGGTYVDLRTNGTRLDELGWEDILSQGGGGGGVSAIFPRPSWQTGVAGVDNPYTTSPPRRQVPDVAAAASAASGYAVYAGGDNAVVGGTSAAAPLWTGSFALIDELARLAIGHPLPFVAPLLYRADALDPVAFYDVTLGGNRFYRAGPGWDYSTGLGAPDMARLAGDVVAGARGG